MLNLSVLIGRLTRDPELKYTPSGIANTTFTLAVDNPYSKDKDADFIPIVVWRQQAEACANYLRKGRLCAVEGRIATRNYEKDGRKVYVTEIIANNVRFLERPENGGQQLERQDPDYSRGVSDDDLPF
ncbi:single-stranded DNA-binding protein [Paenibacillus ottowii]|uniref:Single-stranded DNA-binding protein n=1 Tax=Paenibacillus ottowii TaxID=2315729 RepID=A0ABY3B1X2_9BACL|nr:single-stranded DNA-binding protein [Paenibacillus ottowii]NEU27059.1 single-stranded DNA-binding protein [Paenibacillus polymyxa]TQR97350.1 single-stranded DNA-binding protein [Paenibacillus ottowii]